MKYSYNFLKQCCLLSIIFSPLIYSQTAEEINADNVARQYFENLTTNGKQNLNPEPEALTERFFTGQAAGDQFGISVSTAGDVNGDGYRDIIVGAQGNDAGGSNAGRAYIFFGGISTDNIADVIMTGEVANDNFGSSVSTAGDVNGDGYSDVIVGAYSNDAGGTDAGRSYIYFGGASMDNIADVTMTGVTAGDRFGISVSTAGDVNADGYSDVIVGATLSDAGGTDAGRAYIFFGGTLIDNLADVTMTGEAANDNFGISVSTAGDVNGDGYNDVIVGANFNDAGGSNAGRSYIYFGDGSMDNIADVTMTGEAPGDFFGYSVSTAEDVNGDGYSDVIVGARLNDTGGTDAGRSYIYFGGTSVNNIADVTMTGVTSGDLFGTSVSIAGDVNGDGYSDVIVSANVNDAGGNNAGRAYIFFGDTSMDNIADVIMTGEAAGDFFGTSVSTAGDVNGDGYDDLIVGAYGNDAGGIDAGRAFLYLNSLTGSDIPDEFFTGENVGDQLGYSVSNAGDVNGDGYRDIIVGAPGNDAGGSNAGRAYIFFGGISMDNIADVTMTGEAANDNFGISVSTAGDANGDGYSDVIVGANFNDAGGINAGKVYIYFGGTSMDNIADVTMTGEAANDLFGYSLSTAGDVNGDGYSDVIVGAFQNDAGRSYIYFGGTSMDNIVDVTMTGETTGDQFGTSVSTAGDVNGDGYDDVIVGALGNDAGGIDAGRSYIYFGDGSMDNIADVTMTGEVPGDFFGYSVSAAGDVNSDGYSDIIVGAILNDAGGTDAGRAYIFFGGISMDNLAEVTMTGETADDQFGTSVSIAGDVNGDGYSDVIVGARLNNAGGTNAGRSYIYFGGISMDNIVDVTMTGEAADDQFGSSVSTAGDVNRDGLSDVIVGAVGYSSNTGRAYVYLSSSPPIKPRIKSVKDVPSDQGGYMFVNFVRSGFDAIGESNIITEYLIEMSNPPGVNGFSWWQAGTVQPVQNPLYTFIATTPNDSMTNNSGTYYFRVTARTSDPNESWRSNIMYGHSVDNLAPLAPAAFYANLNGSDVHLGWEANTEPDLKNYLIYRTNEPMANPDTLDIFAEILDTTFTDTNPLTGNAYYFLKSQDIHNNLSGSVADSIVEQTTFALSVILGNGWNMVSVPGINPAGMGVDTWWSGKDPAAGVFKYNGGYVQVTTTTPTEGYWMKNSDAQVYNYPAIEVVAHNDVPLVTGWNLFGLYENTVPTSSITTNPPGIITGSIFEYSGGYQAATDIQPGYGYWAKADAAGSIVNLSAPPLGKTNGDVVEFFPDEWGKIILTDASGINYTLYVVTGEVDLDKYELPPMPPAGMFDIRYGSGRIAEDINSSIQEIQMTGVTYPLTVRVEGMDMRLMDESGRTVNVNLKSGEDVVISDATIQKLMVSGELLPTVYALEQNYPNPFNPSTTIEFSLPENVNNVMLSIYNVLGEKVAELVNGSLVAGRYSYQWNARNVATGMYIYELRTEKFVSVKKMILLK